MAKEIITDGFVTIDEFNKVKKELEELKSKVQHLEKMIAIRLDWDSNPII